MSTGTWDERNEQLTQRLEAIKAMHWRHDLNGAAAFKQADDAAHAVPLLLDVIDTYGDLILDAQTEERMVRAEFERIRAITDNCGRCCQRVNLTEETL